MHRTCQSADRPRVDFTEYGKLDAFLEVTEGAHAPIQCFQQENHSQAKHEAHDGGKGDVLWVPGANR